MEVYIWWAVAGIALIIAELVTGTFFLIVLGVAALAAAAVSYLQYPFWAQAVIAAVVATVGVMLVMRYRAAQTTAPTGVLDVGQSVVLDSWVSEKDRLARVRYRNALWDARIADTDAQTGHVLYIQKVDGSTLHVSKIRPAS